MSPPVIPDADKPCRRPGTDARPPDRRGAATAKRGQRQRRPTINHPPAPPDSPSAAASRASIEGQASPASYQPAQQHPPHHAGTRTPPAPPPRPLNRFAAAPPASPPKRPLPMQPLTAQYKTQTDHSTHPPPRSCSGAMYAGVPSKNKCPPSVTDVVQVGCFWGARCCRDGGEGGRSRWFR